MLIENQIFIACPVAIVWDETIDIDSWPNWTPTVQSAQRLDSDDFGIGSEARLKQPLQPCRIWRVTAFKDGNFFAWNTAGRLFNMRATHTLTPRFTGTQCKLTLELIGPLSNLIGPLLKPLIGVALKQENQRLKSWCESKITSLFNTMEELT